MQLALRFLDRLASLALVAAVLTGGACATSGCASASGDATADATGNSEDAVAAGEASAADVEKSTPNDLSAADAKSVLRQLDAICGDTWCDGDFVYTFKKAVCHFGQASCTITMLVESPYETPARVWWRSCKITGLHGMSDLVASSSSGYASLAPTFYDRMTSCIDQVGASLEPAPTPAPASSAK